MILVPLETNKWYLLDGSSEERREVVNLLIQNGWECNRAFIRYGPAVIRLSTINSTHKLKFITSYSEYYMGKIPIVSAKKLLDRMMNLTQFCQEEEGNMEPTSVQSTKGSRILEVYFRKEMVALEQKCETQINNIKRDNAYVAAINTAIAKINKQLNKDISLQAIGFDVNPLLSEEEHLLIRKTFESIEKEKEALREKYEIAEELLNMADTYKEKKDILDKYTKNVL